MMKFENNRVDEYIKLGTMDLSITDLMFYVIRRMVADNRDVLDNSYILDNGIRYYVKIERENNDSKRTD